MLQMLHSESMARGLREASDLQAASGGRPLRVALYSHDTVGLGHVRRNIRIAETLREGPAGVTPLVLAGVSQADLLAQASGLDCITLPALCKRGRRYEPRSHGISLPRLRELRSRSIRAALEAFAPDVLIVDKVPLGALGELEPSLRHLRSQVGTSCVLGLRDVLDEREVARREWQRDGSEEAIREFYEAVWVYGDPTVLDVAQEYRLSDAVARKIRYTGYLDRRTEPTPPEIELPERFVLCTVGGGEDGTRLAETFSQTELPGDLHGLLLTGPFMPAAVRRQLERCAASNPRLHVLDFLSDPSELMRRAERVVSMGGYNTTCEIVSHEKAALIVPRVFPRREQWIRAERFRELGLVDVCHPADVSPRVLRSWIERDVEPARRDRLDLGGLQRLPELLAAVSPRTDHTAEADRAA